MMKYQTGAHSLTEVHQGGFGGGVGGAAQGVCGSLCGAVFGFFLFLGACGLLWYNEQSTVTIQQELDYLKEVVVPLGESLPAPGEHEGRAIHITGPVEGSILSDNTGPFTMTTKAVSLSRSSEMFQWVERKESTNHKRIAGPSEKVVHYEYYPQWSSTEVNSMHFKLPENHINPRKMKDAHLKAENPHLGQLMLDYSVVEKLPKHRIHLDGTMVKGDVSVTNDYVYLGHDERNPIVGDTRVYYSAFGDGETASVIGIAQKDGLVTGDAKSSVLPLAEAGSVSPDTMIKNAILMNTIFTWFCRVAGFVLVWAGLALCINPINTVVDLIPLPFISGIARFFTGALLFASSISITFIVIASSWCFARPVMSISILAVALAVAWWGRDESRSKSRRD
eukprot:TRINITY_DN17401_c0_g5_i1.p1 TRINITY_DN17401_c0_g5~~TRINITY_DN17401_c0_g5_i1.p1  ORF type:complete len:393 (+),score=62.86 TRINITY_DN17401_c0_g5_i1:46-1224(+)